MSYAQQHNSVKVAFFVNFLKIVWTSKVSAYKNNLKGDYMKGKFGYDFFHLDAYLSTKQLWMTDKDNGMHLFYYPRFVQTDNQSIVLS